MKKSEQKKISIIIPSKIVDYNLRNCVKKIRLFYKYIKIIIILDKKNYFIKDRNIKLIISGPKAIGYKRNLGVKYSKTPFVCFIDSDAYPKHNWLDYVLDSFKKNRNVAVVGGPNLSPQTNNIEKKLVAKVRRLSFVTLDKRVKHRSGNVFYIKFLPSVNMTVKKNIYKKIGGMDNYLNSCEDVALMQTLRKHKYKMLFNSRSYIYHSDRNFKHFFRQRFVYGSNSIRLFLKYPCKESFLFLVGIFPFLSILLFPLIFFKLIFLKIYFFYLFGIIIFCLIISFKINFSNNFIKSLYLTFISVFGPGIGFISSLFLNDKKVRKIYTQK